MIDDGDYAIWKSHFGDDVFLRWRSDVRACRSLRARCSWRWAAHSDFIAEVGNRNRRSSSL